MNSATPSEGEVFTQTMFTRVFAPASFVPLRIVTSAGQSRMAIPALLRALGGSFASHRVRSVTLEAVPGPPGGDAPASGYGRRRHLPPLRCKSPSLVVAWRIEIGASDSAYKPLRTLQAAAHMVP